MLQNLRLASSLLSGHPQLSVHRRAQNSQDQGGRHCHPLLFLPLKEQLPVSPTIALSHQKCVGPLWWKIHRNGEIWLACWNRQTPFLPSVGCTHIWINLQRQDKRRAPRSPSPSLRLSSCRHSSYSVLLRPPCFSRFPLCLYKTWGIAGEGLAGGNAFKGINA